MPVGNVGAGTGETQTDNTNQGGNSNQGVNFDVGAFRTELLGEVGKLVNTAVNGGIKGLKNDFQKMLDSLKPTQTENTEETTQTGNTTTNRTEIKDFATANAQIADLTKKISLLESANRDMVKREQDAINSKLESERHAAWKDTLASIPFRDGAMRSGAFDMFLKNVVRQDDGTFLYKMPNGQDFPLDAAAKNLFIDGEQSWMIQPKGQGGAGANNGNTKGSIKDFNIEDLTVDQIAAMKPEEKKEYYRQIATAAGERR